MSISRQFFSIQEVTSFIVGCSFCANEIRRDVLSNKTSNAREDVRRDADLKGWRSMAERAGHTTNFCPECSEKAMEAGLLKKIENGRSFV